MKEALKTGVLELYEPNYRRNFVHVNDVAAAIEFAIFNFDKTKNNIFNLVLGNENIMKSELAKMITQYNRNIKISEISGPSDPDQRDYIVSSRKIEELGFEFKFNIKEGISEMSEYYRNLERNTHA